MVLNKRQKKMLELIRLDNDMTKTNEICQELFTFHIDKKWTDGYLLLALAQLLGLITARNRNKKAIKQVYKSALVHYDCYVEIGVGDGYKDSLT